MRLERLALKGFSSAFPDVVDVPLRDVDRGLVALVGLKVSALEHLEPETLLASVRNLIASIEEPEKARVDA